MYITTNINNNIIILSLIFAQAIIVYETYTSEKGMPSDVSTQNTKYTFPLILRNTHGVFRVVCKALKAHLIHCDYCNP